MQVLCKLICQETKIRHVVRKLNILYIDLLGGLLVHFRKYICSARSSVYLLRFFLISLDFHFLDIIIMWKGKKWNWCQSYRNFQDPQRNTSTLMMPLSTKKTQQSMSMIVRYLLLSNRFACDLSLSKISISDRTFGWKNEVVWNVSCYWGISLKRTPCAKQKCPSHRGPPHYVRVWPEISPFQEKKNVLYIEVSALEHVRRFPYSCIIRCSVESSCLFCGRMRIMTYFPLTERFLLLKSCSWARWKSWIHLLFFSLTSDSQWYSSMLIIWRNFMLFLLC